MAPQHLKMGQREKPQSRNLLIRKTQYLKLSQIFKILLILIQNKKPEVKTLKKLFSSQAFLYPLTIFRLLCQKGSDPFFLYCLNFAAITVIAVLVDRSMIMSIILVGSPVWAAPSISCTQFP